MSLEKTVRQLETLLEELESDALSLDAAVEKYAQAVKLGGVAAKQLHSVETKILTLKKRGQAVVAADIS